MSRFSTSADTRVALVCSPCIAMDRFVILGVYCMTVHSEGNEFAEGEMLCVMCGSAPSSRRHYWHLGNELLTTTEIFGDARDLNWTPEGLANVFDLDVENVQA